jgi:hypothetical protein
VVFRVKIVFAATPEQAEKVRELVENVYSNIFPVYFTDREINEFERHNVLRASTRHYETFDTLKDAYKVITSLQTIISILELYEPKNEYQPIFDKNVSMLNEQDLYFPFSFDQFKANWNINSDMLSIYSSAANEWLA